MIVKICVTCVHNGGIILVDTQFQRKVENVGLKSKSAQVKKELTQGKRVKKEKRKKRNEERRKKKERKEERNEERMKEEITKE